MSHRDIAAALGVSNSELSRWKALAALGESEFERRIHMHRDRRTPMSATSIINLSRPVPARGPVQRAAAIYTTMSTDERRAFLERIGASA